MLDCSNIVHTVAMLAALTVGMLCKYGAGESANSRVEEREQSEVVCCLTSQDVIKVYSSEI